MCLTLFAWQSHPEYPLVLVSNRDEFYTRGTRPAAWWGQAVSVLAGRDEEAGGTWLGINRSGRFALVTNVRAPSERNPHAPSRGSLVVAALQAAEATPAWLGSLTDRAAGFNGFNLLVGDVQPTPDMRAPVDVPARTSQLTYFSNRLEEPPRNLAPGIYGLSNALLDTPWPKLTRGVARFACLVAQKVDAPSLFALMANRTLARDSELPSTGVPLEWERVLSAIQIRANGYGTRSTTVLTVRRDGLVSFIERTFEPDAPDRYSDRSFEFVIAVTNRLPRFTPRADRS